MQTQIYGFQIAGLEISSGHIAAEAISEAKLSAGVVAKLNNTMPIMANGTRPPTITDDDAGTGGAVYSIGAGNETTSIARAGMLWIDQANGEAYRCLSAATGDADWVKTTLSSDEMGVLAYKDIDFVNLNAQLASVSQVTGLQTVLDGKAGIVDVQNNTNSIAQNLTAIQGNDADIAALEALTAGHTTDIASNVTNIAENVTNIAGNLSQIQSNDADILALQGTVAGHTTDIASNATNIATVDAGAVHIVGDETVDGVKTFNKQTTLVKGFKIGANGISGVSTSIRLLESATHLGVPTEKAVRDAIEAIVIPDVDLSTIEGNITTLQGQMTTVQGDVTALETLTAGHTTDIATNAAGVASNLAAIQSSATNISTLQGDVTALETLTAGHTTDIAQNVADIAALELLVATKAPNFSEYTNDFVGDGSARSFNFLAAADEVLKFDAYYNGLKMKESEYSIVDNTLTLDAAQPTPTASMSISISCLYKPA